MSHLINSTRSPLAILEKLLKDGVRNSLISVLEYLQQEWGKDVADDFLLKVDVRIASLQRHPFIGMLTTAKTVRGIHITKHNRLYYKVEKNKVTILNLYDTRTKSY